MRNSAKTIIATLLLLPLFASLSTWAANDTFGNNTSGSNTLTLESGVINGIRLQGSLLRGSVKSGSKVTLNGANIPVSNNGDFVFGFSRDETQEAALTIKNNQEIQTVIIKPEVRNYRIQRIDGLEQSKVTPPTSVLARIRNDGALVSRARSGTSDLEGFKEAFIWPAQGPISGIYGSQRILNGKPSRPHFGVDVASPEGTEVVAPASGRVTMAHPDLYYSGGTIIIDHGMGVFSTFLHLSQLSVKNGQMVQQGQKIGAIGETGRATGPHLDWRINWQKMRLDPALLVNAREGLDYTSQAYTANKE